MNPAANRRHRPWRVGKPVGQRPPNQRAPTRAGNEPGRIRGGALERIFFDAMNI